MSNQEKIKIYTFESNSAGGIICVLLYAKTQFKVKKLDVDEWDVKKQKFDYEALPIVKINKVQYTHEIPTLLYLGKKFNLLGETYEDEYITSNLLYAVNDLKEKILPAFLPESKEEYENQQLNIDELLEETLPFYLKQFESFLKGKDYFLGKKISVHPLRIKLLDQVLKENAPNLDNLVTSLSQNDLKEYYSTYFLINSPL